MRRFRSFGWLGLLSLFICLSACGETHVPLDLVEWPYLERPQALKINGTEVKAYITNNEGHRRRARTGLALHENEAIAYLYPASKEPLEFELGGVTEAVDLVFVDAQSKVIRTETLAPFVQSTFPLKYSVKDARLVLQMPKGMADKLKLSAGAAITTEPDLVKSSDQAVGDFSEVYFITEQRGDDKPVNAPSVRIRALEKLEDVAQGMKDRPDFKEGEGIMVAYGQAGHFSDFWLKETDGAFCACFLERTGGRGGGNLVVLSMYENIKAEGARDIDRPIYSAPDQASHLLLFKGADFFTRNNVQARSRVVITGLQRYDNDKPDYNDLTLKFGDRKLSGRLATAEAERQAGLLAAPGLARDKAIIFNFDDASFVEFDPAGMQGEARLLFVSGDGAGKYSINERKLTSASARIKAGDIKDGRFVIAVPKDFDVSGFEMPYVLRDLKPSTAAIAFYPGKSEVVNDRWPKDAKAKARVELALTEAEQHKGLMFRENLRPDHGMLFAYKTEQEDGVSYWMKNCKMDISIAFIDRKGVIVKIHNRMKAPAPGTPDYQLEQYPSNAPTRYAVEMEPDWFAKNNINVGDRVFIPARFTSEE
ncbi:MAG: DUF192 domain-containing protein [Planctomycetes bacterium]|nr:DUF192 domain-containing protein [Planctomycetota bacterium]